MIDKNNLSKYKKIYMFHKSEKDPKIICEVFPIVYINKRYVYFRVPGNDLLEYVDLSRVHETISDWTAKENNDITRIFNLFESGYRVYTVTPSMKDSKYIEFKETSDVIGEYRAYQKLIQKIEMSIKATDLYIMNSLDDIKTQKKRLAELESLLKTTNEEFYNFSKKNNLIKETIEDE